MHQLIPLWIVTRIVIHQRNVHVVVPCAQRNEDLGLGRQTGKYYHCLHMNSSR